MTTTRYLATGYWRGRVQPTKMRVFDKLSDAWAWALTQDQVNLSGDLYLLAHLWEVSDTVEAKLLKPKDIQKTLGLPPTIKGWLN